MAAPASASSSQVKSTKHDVFISFRGPDVRFGFLSHLEGALHRKSIEVFVDDRLERGEEISSSLVNAIKGSKIALVIFSKDYASSRWCLEELVKIMELNEAHQQIVIPIFYLVDPKQVRHQTHSYAKAFTLHEEEFKEKVEIWRSVLKKSASLCGYHSSQFQNERELIDAVVQHVLKKLEDDSSIVPKSNLIGFHRNFASVQSLMEFTSHEVRIVGIWGMGGIGKTTLAHAIYDKFRSEFEGYCFLENVRDKSLISLRDELLSKLLGKKDDAVRWLQRKRVLIVLDNVDNPKQLTDLVGQQLHLGLGSRVIVTSRDKQVLRSGGILDKYIHEVNTLNFEKSLELFSIHAFNQNRPTTGYEELSETTVATAGGLPLALEVLGCHFHSRGEACWKSELRKLKKYPHERIQNILKISYDGLHVDDKEIFVDIAFFFRGTQQYQITSILEACGFEPVSGIQNLIDKALIKLDEYGHIVMHDLILEMAEQIVCERGSRIKDADEVYDILESNMGTTQIEGIILKQSKREYPPLGADFFIKMKKLRILIILARINLPFSLNYFPNKLRYLNWKFCPLEFMPAGSCFKSLVELHLEHSNFKKLWDGKQDLANLKEINLSFSKQLLELPDLSKAHKLEIVNLHCCENLRSVHPSILSLHTIVEMDVSFCCNLESLESETHLKSLSRLNVNGCNSLKRLWLSAEKLRYIILSSSDLEILRLPTGCFTELRRLDFNGERLCSLPIDGLCWSTNLEEFRVLNFKQDIETKELHSLFDSWRNLEKLCLDGWSKLSEMPDNIKGLTRLYELSLDDSGVETLPVCINNLSSLRYISLRRCKRLKSIPGLPPSLVLLDASDCTALETVSSESLLSLPCDFHFDNCVKLDESSLRFIEEELAYSSSHQPFNLDFNPRVCYPGSRVPKWMKYKQMTKASNTIQFTIDKASPGSLVLCCIAPPHLMSKTLRDVFCYVTSDYDRFRSQYYSEDLEYSFEDVELITDHVFIWNDEWWLHGNISCEFFLECWDEEEKKVHEVPAEACGVHIIYKSESESELGQKRKRDADISTEDGLFPTKQLKNHDDDDFICHPLQLKFLGRAKQKELSLIHFL